MCQTQSGQVPVHDISQIDEMKWFNKKTIGAAFFGCYSQTIVGGNQDHRDVAGVLITL